MTETHTPSVFQALSQVMSDVQAVGKKDRNQQQGYDFRGIDAVVNQVGPAFRKYGIICTPVKSEAKYRDVLTNSGKPSRECTVSVTYRFYGPAGDYLDAEVPGESMDFGDKGAPKAMSVAYRIALLQVLCIPTHDPEPDASTYERAPVQDEWDPIEQAALMEVWTATIEKADTVQLAQVAQVLLTMKRKKELSPASYDHLKIIGGKRRGELDAAANQPELTGAPA